MENKKMAIVGMTNNTTMNLSKGITFVGSVITFIGLGGMLMSRKWFTEAEMEYLAKHLAKNSK